MQSRITTLFIILSIAGLSACGFQLRGTGGALLPENWKRMNLVTGNPNSEFSREITSSFAASGVQWLAREEANYSLVVQPERFDQDNLSLNSEARAAEYELTMSTQFIVYDANKNVAMEETKVTVIKQMENDPRNVVGKDEEVRLLQAEMRTELAQQILRRIGFYASSTQPATQLSTHPSIEPIAVDAVQPDAQPNSQ